MNLTIINKGNPTTKASYPSWVMITVYPGVTNPVYYFPGSG
jgi:hypothetical protein